MIVRVLTAENPLASMILAKLRDRNTGLRDFRYYMKLAGIILGVEVARFLEWSEVQVETPLGEKARELELKNQPLVISILGAAIPLVEGFLEVYPEAPVGLVAARRVEEGEQLEIEVKYSRMPPKWEGASVVLDPMLATGMTISRAVEEAKSIGSSRVIVATVIAATDGLKKLAQEHPDSIVVTLAVDPRLDDKFFIRPGLGDAGDRGLGVRP